jgi:transposase-like protein
MSSIEAVLAAIESLEPGKQFSYRQIAKEYGCDRTTLARRHQGVRALRRIKAEISRLSIHNRSRSFYNISNGSQSEAYHLPEL